MTEELDIIESVNKEVLRSFKCLQRDKNNLYTMAVKEFLTSINDKSMIVYDNPLEIDFEGTFRLTRNKLIPVDDCVLTTDPTYAINLNHFKHLGDFNKNINDLQKFCYDKNIRINMVDINESIDNLISLYKNYKLYRNLEKEEVMFVFQNAKHKTYLLSKLI